MYIEFTLPSGPGGASFVNNFINQELHAWSDRYDIPYNTKIVKNKKRITFDNDEAYSLFAMTWNPDERFYTLSKWRIVSDLNNKSSFDSPV